MRDQADGRSDSWRSGQPAHRALRIRVGEWPGVGRMALSAYRAVHVWPYAQSDSGRMAQARLPVHSAVQVQAYGRSDSEPMVQLGCPRIVPRGFK